MKILGLTGGSGAGKGAAAAYFEALGAGVVDADAVYRDLCRQNQDMLAALAAAFGPVLTPEGALDRPALARVVFSDPAALSRLNALTQPYIRAASLAAFDALQEKGCPLALYDAPTLFQTGGEALCSGVIGVIAPRDMRLARIIARDGLSPEAAAARIDAQPDDAFYRSRCDYLIDNSGDRAGLEAQVRTIFAQISPK